MRYESLREGFDSGHRIVDLHFPVACGLALTPNACFGSGKLIEQRPIVLQEVSLDDVLDLPMLIFEIPSGECDDRCDVRVCNGALEHCAADEASRACEDDFHVDEEVIYPVKKSDAAKSRLNYWIEIKLDLRVTPNPIAGEGGVLRELENGRESRHVLFTYPRLNSPVACSAH